MISSHFVPSELDDPFGRTKGGGWRTEDGGKAETKIRAAGRRAEDGGKAETNIRAEGGGDLLEMDEFHIYCANKLGRL